MELYLAGSVEATWRQVVRRDPGKPPQGCSELARAQYGVLHGQLYPRRLEGRERVRQATAAVSRKLEREGLLLTRRRLFAVRTVLLAVFAAAPLVAFAGRETPLGPFLLLLLSDAGAVLLWAWPRRTRRGAALLARMRRERAGVRQATEREPAGALLGVALFGATALHGNRNLARFTAESGLLGRPPREPMERGGSAEETFSCGG